MNKTGLEKMVGVLKSQLIKTEHGDLSEFGEGCVYFLKDMIDNAEMFLKQEQAQKHTDMEESLAELADRKGFGRILINSFRGEWFIRFLTYEDVAEKSEYRYNGKTYIEAESKAREYLNTIPDEDTK